MLRSPFFILSILFSLFSCHKESKEIYRSKQNDRHAYSLLKKAEELFNNEKFDSAFFYYNKSKQLYEIENDSVSISYCLYQMSRAQQTYGDYNGSEETLTELLDYKLVDYIAPAYNLLGIASKELSNYDDAIINYTTALKSTQKEIDKQSPLNNIGTVYIQKGEYQKAVLIFESILKTHLLDSDISQNKKARVLDNLGFAYFKLKRNKEGGELMNRRLDIRNELKDTYGIIESYLHLAEYYQDVNSQKSNEYALMAYRNATLHKSIDERLESLSFLMKNNIISGKNKYAIQFITLNDSIVKLRNNAKNQFAKIKYDSKKDKEENQKLKLEKAESLLQIERIKFQRLLSFFGVVLLVIFIVVIVRYFRNKNKREKQKAIYDTETRISKQLHDELANNVFQVMSFAKTQDLQNPNKKETLLDNLDKIYKKARDISRAITDIDTTDKYESNLKLMLSEYANNEVKVIIKDNHEINWNKVQSNSKVAVYRVLQELLVNMKKHSQANIVVVGFENVGNKIQIKYSDNGVGIPAQLNLKNGLKNVENRILSIKGTITFETDSKNGFRLNFSIPK